VILFDEIEKASSEDVFTSCCRFLKDGRLTDGKGPHRGFPNTVLVMTSNVGPRPLFSSWLTAIQNAPPAKKRWKRCGRGVSGRSFINRIDENRDFQYPLAKEQLGAPSSCYCLRGVEHLLAERPNHSSRLNGPPQGIARARGLRSRITGARPAAANDPAHGFKIRLADADSLKAERFRGDRVPRGTVTGQKGRYAFRGA